MTREAELIAALEALGWEIDHSRRTPNGWKAMIRRGDSSILRTGSSSEDVLEALLADAQGLAQAP